MRLYTVGNGGKRDATLLTGWTLSAGLVLTQLLTWLFLGSDGAWWFAQSACILASGSIAPLALMVAFRLPPRSNAQLAWVLVLVASTLMFFREVFDAFDAGPRWNEGIHFSTALDVTGTVAMLALIGVLAVRGGSGTVGWRRRVRMLLDMVVLAVMFADVVFLTLTSMFGGLPSFRTQDAVLSTALATVGFWAIGAAAMFTIRRWGALRSFEKPLLVGGIFLASAYTWLVLLDMRGVNLVAHWMWLLGESASLVGYLLFALGGLTRLMTPGEPVAFSAPAPTARSVWPSVVLSSTVFGVMAALVVMVAWASPDSEAWHVHFRALTIVTFCVVARTAVAASEMRRLREFATTDSLTGAYDAQRLSERLEEYLARYRRFGDSFMVGVIGVHQKGSAGHHDGHSTPPETLRSTADALMSVAGQEYGVFRLDGDDFIVVRPVESAAVAGSVARRLHLATDETDVEDSVELTVGYAFCPEDATDAETLLAHAYGAQLWARHHAGRGYARYDSATMRALADEKRFGLSFGKSQMDIVHALSAAADARHAANYGHSRNVATLAVMLAESIGLDSERCNRIRVAAILHDVGKLALPDAVLRPEAAGAREHSQLREHCVLGSRLVESLPLRGVSDWVRWHHERWDGAGYPDGLLGEQIPLEARIIAIADAYDTMVTGGSSGSGMSRAAALQEIDFGLGTRFDPALGEAFIIAVGSAGLLGWSEEWTAA